MSEITNKELENQLAEMRVQAGLATARIATLEAETQEKDEMIASLRGEVAALQEQADAVPELNGRVEDLSRQLAEVQDEATRAELRQFASAHGLDLEDEAVAKAIAELDHKTLMAESARMAAEPAKPVTAPHAFSAGLQAEPYGGLLGNE